MYWLYSKEQNRLSIWLNIVYVQLEVSLYCNNKTRQILHKTQYLPSRFFSIALLFDILHRLLLAQTGK